MLFAGGFAILSVRQRVAANHPTTAVMGKPERCLDRSTGIVTCFSRLYNPGSVHRVSGVRLHISAEIGLLSLAQWDRMREAAPAAYACRESHMLLEKS